MKRLWCGLVYGHPHTEQTDVSRHGFGVISKTWHKHCLRCGKAL